MGVSCALEIPRQLINLLLHYNVATAIWNAIYLWLGVRGISPKRVFRGDLFEACGFGVWSICANLLWSLSFVEAGKNLMEAALINLPCSKSGYLMSFSDQAVLSVMANLLNRSWIEVTLIFHIPPIFPRQSLPPSLGPTYFTLMPVRWKTFGL